MPWILNAYGVLVGALTGEGAGTSVVSIDFTDMLKGAVNQITGDFGTYAAIAGTAAFAVWAAPKAIVMVKKFFNAVSR